MAFDVPIAIRLLRVLDERPSTFPALRNAIEGDPAAPSADATFFLLEILHREGLIEWTLSAPAGTAARLKDARARDERVLYVSTQLGREKVGEWMEGARSAGVSVEDHARLVPEDPRRPNSFSGGVITMRAGTREAIDRAVILFGSLIPQIKPVYIAIDKVVLGQTVQIRMRYGVSKVCVAFDPRSIHFRTLSDSWDLPWTSVVGIGVRGVPVPVDDWVVIKTTDGRVKKLDLWWGQLPDFARALAGPKKPSAVSWDWFTDWYWRRDDAALPDLRGAFARFWDETEIAARERRDVEERAESELAFARWKKRDRVFNWILLGGFVIFTITLIIWRLYFRNR